TILRKLALNADGVAWPTASAMSVIRSAGVAVGAMLAIDCARVSVDDKVPRRRPTAWWRCSSATGSSAVASDETMGAVILPALGTRASDRSVRRVHEDVQIGTLSRARHGTARSRSP